ncbi:hypothetical protein RN51_01638 [Microbacterium oxydans]|uniref:Uncharacterized protein n=1 Tax=Microbacterium oxydans TaxID=82380 RepID=A0A0F0KPU7_9MICO|nr:hypothetical protein [Microbacterium oxydans]KJL22893.1 hypothetical protein RN51_01638 [Microbacterium oxydans]
MYEIEHLLADAWYEYNSLLDDAFAIPVSFVKDGQLRVTEWVPTFMGMLRYQGTTARQLDGRELFMVEVVDADSADLPIVRAKARAAQQYSNVVGGALLAVLVRKDGAFFVVNPEGQHTPLKSHVFNPHRRMTAAVTQRKRLALELAGQGADYAAMFRRLGLTDHEVATWLS